MAQGRILVIEDEDLLRSMILEVLETDGYETADAPDERTGLRLVREHTPDLVVLDLNLPAHMKGLDICRAIRADPATSHIAVLMLIPLLLWFDRFAPIRAATWVRSLLSHVALSVVFSFAHVALMYRARVFVFQLYIYSLLDPAAQTAT